MNKKNKKRKQLEEAIGQEFMNPDREALDMTPIMSDVLLWGKQNIPAKEIDRILTNHKKIKN
tara:strand:+ start:259 stop:444 length:186 start_codon:yes stop_codon:yes gene_type:complete